MSGGLLMSIRFHEAQCNSIHRVCWLEELYRLRSLLELSSTAPISDRRDDILRRLEAILSGGKARICHGWVETTCDQSVCSRGLSEIP